MGDEYRQPRSPLEGVDQKGRRERQEAPRKHEEETAVSLGGRRQRGSGCAEAHKGDVTDIGAGRFDFLSECKTTQGVSLRLEARWLNKITTEAKLGNRLPMLNIRFEPRVLDSLASVEQQLLSKRVITAEADWVAVPQSVMKAMFQQIRFGGEE